MIARSALFRSWTWPPVLDRLTGGWYRSTLHRVRNATDRDRFSFFAPDFTAQIPPLSGRAGMCTHSIEPTATIYWVKHYF
jgi:isopenicillin N synthase-like dioxygenase